MIDESLKPTVYTREMSLDLRHFPTGQALESRLSSALMDLTENLRENGCPLIGHIKGVVDFTETGASLFFSVTNFRDQPTFRGEVPEGAQNACMIVNVIVYGLDFPAVKKISEKVFVSSFKDYPVQIGIKLQ